MDAMAVTYEWSPGEPHTLHAHKIDLATNAEVDFLSGKYKPLSKSQEELRVDVSSAIGLFERKSEIGPHESARLERCLADLLMLLVQPEFSSKGKTILVEGPPFPKLVGRIGYRYPRADLTIAFVTPDERFLKNASFDSGPNTPIWDGPFPGYEEERITRTFFHGPANTRVDLFSQGLNRYPQEYTVDGYPLGIKSKLAANSERFLAFSNYLREKNGEVQRTFRFVERNEGLRKAARDDVPMADKEVIPSVRTVAGQSIIKDAGLVSDPPGLEAAIFKGVSSAAPNTQTGQQRYMVLRQFFDEDGIVLTAEKFRFLQYIEERMVEKKSKKTYVYTLNELRDWYSAYQRMR